MDVRERRFMGMVDKRGIKEKNDGGNRVDG